MPFGYLGPSLVKLANIAEPMPEGYDRIARLNAAEFLCLDIAGLILGESLNPQDHRPGRNSSRSPNGPP